MEHNMMDLVVEEVKERREEAHKILNQQYKRTNPYRKEPVPDKERLLEYEMMPEYKKEFARNDSNLAPYFAEYEKQMQEIRGRYE